MIRNLGMQSLMRILPNLPDTCREQLQGILDKGWNCGFYFGVYKNRMYFCIAAKKGEYQHLVAADDSKILIDRLYGTIISDA